MNLDFLAARVKRIKPSPSVGAKARVVELASQGRDIIDFTVGEPDFDTPAHIVAAAHQAALRGETRYTAATGTPQLRRAICDKLQRENGVVYGPGEILVGAGAKHVIYCALAATVQHGDEVIVPAPYWVSYPDMVQLNGGTPVIVPCPAETGFKLTPAELERHITPRTKWLILNSPNNPSGAIYSAVELAALCNVLLRHPHVWLMTDEIYEHFNYDRTPVASAVALEPALRERTLIVNGVSKAYAMTGWRIGYGAGPAELISVLGTLLTQSAGSMCAVSQAAAIEALSGDQTCVRQAAADYAERRDRIVAGLNGVPGLQCDVPQGAFYAFPNCAGLIGRQTPEGAVLANDQDVAAYFLEAASVAVIDGAAYGLSPYLRISFATSLAQLDLGCQRMTEAAERLR
ncbi:aminotransferase class I/II-fold pyridoxal phosphate-dependent enzyme [Bordetella petrii]|nr:aminotransferase class I/II-fold pyridoxal phosphate-dependent enzyme [Bordetella petrii]